MEEIYKNSNWDMTDKFYDRHIYCGNIDDMQKYGSALVNRLLEFDFVKLPDEEIEQKERKHIVAVLDAI